MVKLLFSCDGCDATADGTTSMKKRFVSVSGRDYGIGNARWVSSPEDLAPEGWIAADQYTYCTYCPKCSAELGLSPVEADKRLRLKTEGASS